MIVQTNVTAINNQTTDYDKQDAIDMMLSAIAQTEFGLAEIIQAEADKIEIAIQRHADNAYATQSETEDLLSVNKSVERTLRKIIIKEMLLGFQLEDIIEMSQQPQYLMQSNNNTLS